MVSYDLRTKRVAVQKTIQWKLKIRSPISVCVLCECTNNCWSLMNTISHNQKQCARGGHVTEIIGRRWRLHTIWVSAYNWQSFIVNIKYIFFSFSWNNHFNSNLFTAASHKLINKNCHFRTSTRTLRKKYARHTLSIKLQRDRQRFTLIYPARMHEV